MSTRKAENSTLKKFQADIPRRLVTRWKQGVAALLDLPEIESRKQRVLEPGPMAASLMFWFLEQEEETRNRIAVEAVLAYDAYRASLNLAPDEEEEAESPAASGEHHRVVIGGKAASKHPNQKKAR